LELGYHPCQGKMRQAFLLPPARGLLVSVRQGEGKKGKQGEKKKKEESGNSKQQRRK
jgi:hypothetical protein